MAIPVPGHPGWAFADDTEPAQVGDTVLFKETPDSTPTLGTLVAETMIEGELGFVLLGGELDIHKALREQVLALEEVSIPTAKEPRYKVGDTVFAVQYRDTPCGGSGLRGVPLNKWGEIFAMDEDDEDGMPYLVDFGDDESWCIGDEDIDHERTVQGAEKPTLPFEFEFEWNGRTWQINTEDDDMELLVKSEDSGSFRMMAYIDPDMSLTFCRALKVDLP